MNVDFSEEQQVLREMVRSLCEEHSPIEVVRKMEDDSKGYPDTLWQQLAQVGLLGLLVPEALGGAGQGLLEAVIVHEELGRALAPSPAFVSSVVAARVLQEAASVAQQRAWLPRIACGDAILTPAWLEPGGGFGARGVQLCASKQGNTWRLSGKKRSVPFARAATRMIVLARSGDGPEEIGLFLVDPAAAGVALQQTRSLASDCVYDVCLEDVALPEEACLGAADSGWARWETAMYDAIIVLAAQAMGGCQKAHEITTQYAKDRTQFGKPLGAFQAISHYLADALTAIDGGRTLVHEAAWMRDQGRDIRRLAPMAKLFACDTYRDTTAMCQQVWGGVGFTLDYDIQLYFRRAKQLQVTWWDGPTLEERIAADVLDR